MAGEEGFEPSNAGIKIRCLNQLGDSPAEKPARLKRRILPSVEPVPCVMRTPRAGVVRAFSRQSPASPCGRAATAARASVSEANGANTQPPDPVIRALAECADKRRERRGDVRKSCNRGRLQVIAPITLGKDVHFRRRAVACQFSALRRSSAVGTATARARSRRPRSAGIETGVRRSPMPRASAGSPPRKNGTSAPSATPKSRRARRASCRAPTSRLSASSTDAASELPPPRPPPIGMRLTTAMSTPRRATRAALQRARRANREVALRAERRSHRRRAPNRAVVALRERDRVAEVERDEQRLEQCDSRRRAGPSRAGTG